MKKKILIGSIIAVVLLTLVSFTSAVGYSSVESDRKIISPLFGIRTKRAINNKQDAITSDYIGKGKAINILLPKRNDDVNLMYRMINFISKTNDKTFDRIDEQIRYVREYPDEVKNVVTVDNIGRDITSDFCATFNNGAFPLMCYIMTILELIIVDIIMYILDFLTHTSSLICKN